MNDNRSTEPRTEANCPHTYLSCDDCEEGFTRRAIEAEAAAQALSEAQRQASAAPLPDEDRNALLWAADRLMVEYPSTANQLRGIALRSSAAPDEGLREALETALVALEAVARQPDSAAIRVNASSVAYAIRRALPEDQS